MNYYTASLYTTKEDENFIQSPDHPDLANSGPPGTMSASQARIKRRPPVTEDSPTDSTSGGEGEDGEKKEREGGYGRTSTSVKRRRSQRLSCFDVSNIIVEKTVVTKLEQRVA